MGKRLIRCATEEKEMKKRGKMKKIIIRNSCMKIGKSRQKNIIQEKTSD